ncbi:MAG TPA: VOC family protein [Usitatibacter sp.]|nr:VOC family protein [Usitatibacter sp.]
MKDFERVTTFDHLVVAARALEEGAAWVEARLGAATVAGGKHALMGTHNRLLSLGPARFLEVIAVDPDARAPPRPRWFGLDSPAMCERLARGPALIHWVVRTGDLEAALRDYPQEVDVLSLARGEYRWRIGIPQDGRLPCGGACPTLIQWEGAAHPAAALPDSGCTLLHLETGVRLRATFATPQGVCALP